MSVGRFAYTPLLVLMRADDGLSLALAGMLASVNLAGYLIGAMLAMHPRLHARRRAAIGYAGAGVVLSTAAMMLPNWSWIAARLATGVCSGIAFVSLVGVVFDLVVRRPQRYAIAIFFSGLGTGIAVVGILVPLFARLGGSRAAWGLLALVSAIALALAFPALPDPPSAEPAERRRAAAGETRGPFGPLALVYGVQGAAYIVPATFLVAMAAESAALAPYAALSWVVVGAVAAPSMLVWTLAAERLGLTAALLLALALQTASLLSPSVAAPPVDAILVALGLGGTFMGITALATALGRAYRPENPARAVAVLTAWYGVGQIVGPLAATPVVALTGSYRPALVFAGAALLAATVLFALQARGSERRPRQAL